MKLIKNNWLLIVMSSLVVLAAVIAYSAYQIYTDSFCSLLPNGTEQVKRANWGAFGDYFGGILNPFFAFFGLIMLLATLLQTQKELNLTRNEIKKSSKALSDQAATQEKQRFEGTFFQLINLHQKIVESMQTQYSHDSNTVKGRDCFAVFIHKFRRDYEGAIRTAIGAPEPAPHQGPIDLSELPKEQVDEAGINVENIKNGYEEFYDTNQNELGHYYRSIYNIIKFVHRSNQEDKRLYSNILRAQMSENESVLLFYNSLTVSNQGLKKYIEEYTLLKSLPKKELLDERHLGFYKSSAFE